MEASASHRATWAAAVVLFIVSTSGAEVAAQPSSATSASSKSSTAVIVIVAGVAALFAAGLLLSAFGRFIGPCLFGVEDGGGGRRRAPVGLSREVVEGFPTYLYGDVKVHRRESKGELECAICLSEFQDDETLRLLPECDHAFHPQCIDPWLLSQTTCPICRRDLDASSDAEQIANESDASNVDAHDHHLIIVEPHPPVGSPVREGQGSQDPSEPELTTKRIKALFSKPHSTGHSPVWTVGPEDRFTLRISEEARKKIAERCHAEVHGMSSGKKGYRPARNPWFGKPEVDGSMGKPVGLVSVSSNPTPSVSCQGSPMSDSGICYVSMVDSPKN